MLTLPISKDFRDTLYSGSFQVSFSNGASASWGETKLKLHFQTWMKKVYNPTSGEGSKPV